jgi:Ca-activated chloride channel family protein
LTRRSQLAAVLALLFTAIGPPSLAQSDRQLPAVYWQEWLTEVDLLMGERERAAFDALESDVARRAFVRGFWRARDPVPHTAWNELRDEWAFRIRAAQTLGTLGGPRGDMVLGLGPPGHAREFVCGDLRVQVLRWEAGRDTIGGAFVSRQGGPIVPERKREQILRIFDDRDCPTVHELSSIWVDLPRARALRRLYELPPPEEAWLADFTVPAREEAEGLATNWELPGVNLVLSFPQRFVDGAQLRLDFRLDSMNAEVSPSERLLESLLLRARIVGEGNVVRFWHRHFVPIEADSEPPLFRAERLVGPPGPVTMEIELERTGGELLYRRVFDIDIPGAEQGGSEPAIVAPRMSFPFNNVWELASRPRLHLDLSTGAVVGTAPVRIEVAGRGVEEVRLALDGRLVARLTQEPFEAEVDFGDSVATHELVAIGLDASATPVARAATAVNDETVSRFALDLEVSELDGGSRLLAVARPTMAAHEIERVEIWAGEELAGTLHSAPFESRIDLAGRRRFNFVRALAVSRDGRTAEDVALVGVPGSLEELDVDLVELVASAVDGGGRPVVDLGLDEIRILEDGDEQTLREVRTVATLPLSVAVLMDSSGSMESSLVDAKRSASRFFDTVVGELDEGAFLSFNQEPQLQVAWTGDVAALDRGVGAVRAWGGTALWDSLGLALYYFHGLETRRALVLLTDGVDEHSRLAYDELLDLAGRSDTVIYVIALGRAVNSIDTRRLQRLAGATGGRLIAASSARRLDRIYEQIGRELRSQYRISYQSTGRGGGFRRIEAETSRQGVELRTITGYSP